MMKKSLPLLIVCIMLFGAGHAVLAQSGTSEARGQVTDPEGNPLKGVKLTFRNTANELAVYDVTTNKKGRYFLSGLLFYETGLWEMDVELEGYVLTTVKVLSRTQRRVVDEFTANLKPGQKVPKINIRAFGTAVIDCTMIREELVVREVPVEPGTEAAAQSGDTAPAADPFVTALQKAGAGDLEGSVEFFEKAFKKEDASSDPEKLEAYARVLYQLERYDDAESRAAAAAAAGPDLASPHLVLYTVHVAKQDYEAARADLERAGQIDPGDRKVFEQKAWLAQETGRLEDAVAAYARMTELNPADVQAWISLGGLYAKMGDNDSSQQAYQKVVELDPKNAYQTFFNIGALIEQDDRATDQDIQKAIDAYRKAVEIKPDYSQAYKRLGYILLRVGDLKGSREALEKYVELEPEAADAAQIKGMVKSLPR